MKMVSGSHVLTEAQMNDRQRRSSISNGMMINRARAQDDDVELGQKGSEGKGDSRSSLCPAIFVLPIMAKVSLHPGSPANESASVGSTGLLEPAVDREGTVRTVGRLMATDVTRT